MERCGLGRERPLIQVPSVAPGLPNHVPNTARVAILVKDDSGNIVNDLQGTGDAGFNMGVWDLTRAGAQQGQGGFRRGPPIVEPGGCTVELTVESETVKGTIEVRR